MNFRDALDELFRARGGRIITCPYKEDEPRTNRATFTTEPMAFTDRKFRDYVIVFLDHESKPRFWRWNKAEEKSPCLISATDSYKLAAGKPWNTGSWIIPDPPRQIGDWIEEERNICDWTTQNESS